MAEDAKLQSFEVAGRVVARPSKMEILHREQFKKDLNKKKGKEKNKEIEQD